MGWLKKVVKKAAGKVFGGTTKQDYTPPPPPPPPAVAVEVAKTEEKDTEKDVDTASKKKKEKRKGKKGFVVEREKGTGINV